MSKPMIELSVEKFIDKLNLKVGELGTEVIQLIDPICIDTEGHGYVAKSRRLNYKSGVEYDEDEIIDLMVEDMYKEIQSRLKNELTPDSTKLGIYSISLQQDEWDDKSVKRLGIERFQQMIWIRYAFGRKELLHIP